VAIATALAERGDRVFLTARDPNKLEALAASLDRGQGPAPFVTADLTRDDAVDTIVAATRCKVDDIVLACGPFPRTPFEALQRRDLERTLAVHCIAPLLLVHALAADLARGKGAVVALGDAGTTRPFEHHVASKSARTT